MVKQTIIIRKDLKMRRGKEIAQGSHASIAFLTRRLKDNGKGEFACKLTDAEQEWIDNGFTKITLQVDNEKDLLEVYQNARAAGLEAHLIKDAGKTEFNGVPTITCCAIGPDLAEKIDPITKGLGLY